MSPIYFELASISKNQLQIFEVLLYTKYITVTKVYVLFQPSEYGRLKQQWEIARKDVRLVDLVAKGTFVEVWRGRMRKYPRRNEIMKVAIKRIVCKYSKHLFR